MRAVGGHGEDCAKDVVEKHRAKRMAGVMKNRKFSLGACHRDVHFAFSIGASEVKNRFISSGYAIWFDLVPWCPTAKKTSTKSRRDVRLSARPGYIDVVEFETFGLMKCKD